MRVVDARDVVLDREHAALGLGARLHVPRDLVACGEEARVLYLRDEALEGDAVDAGLLHPREVARDGPRVVRRVEPRDRAVGVREVGRIELVRAELGGVWPQIDRQVRRGRRVVAEPVPPLVHRRAVSGAQEPALISEQHLALEARGVDDRRERRRSSRTVVRRSLVAVNGGRVGLITFRRGRRASHAADRGDEQDGREADGSNVQMGSVRSAAGCGLIGRRGREEGLLEVAEARPPAVRGPGLGGPSTDLRRRRAIGRLESGVSLRARALLEQEESGGIRGDRQSDHKPLPPASAPSFRAPVLRAFLERQTVDRREP